MTALEIIGIAAGSSVLAAAVAGLFNLIIKIYERRNSKEDKSDEIVKDIAGIKSDITSLRELVAEQAADGARTRIVRFGDECIQGQKHSQDHFEKILLDADKYEAYCNAHPDYRNSVTTITIGNIKAIYKQCCEEHTFL